MLLLNEQMTFEVDGQVAVTEHPLYVSSTAQYPLSYTLMEFELYVTSSVASFIVRITLAEATETIQSVTIPSITILFNSTTLVQLVIVVNQILH